MIPRTVIGSLFVMATVLAHAQVSTTNYPPAVGMARPMNGATFQAPANILVAAEARDAEGIASVELFAGTNSLGFGVPQLMSSMSTNVYGLMWSNVPPGNYVLTAEATDNTGLSRTSAPISISVLPTPPPPILVSVTASDPVASEPCVAAFFDPAQFTIFRDSGTDIDLTVLYEIGGTAKNGVDYRAITNKVMIPRGVASVNIPIVALADTLLEGDETVIIHLIAPACIALYPPPRECYQVGTPAMATVTIKDCQTTNYPPMVRLVAPPSGAVFPPGADIPIVAGTMDRDGYCWKVEFFDRTNKIGEAVKYFTVVPTNGTPISFDMVWSNVPPGRYALKAVATDNDSAKGISQWVEITVGTNPPPTIVTVRAPDPYASEPCRTASAVLDNGLFKVCRSGPTNVDLPVTLLIGGTAQNGIDYKEITNRVVIPKGAFCVEIPITPLADNLAEGPESVVMRVVPPPCAAMTVIPFPEDCYVVGQPSEAAVYIRDCQELPPMVRLLKPAQGMVFPPGANIGIMADTVDPDGYCYKVEFFNRTNKIGEQIKEFFAVPTNGTHIAFEMVWSNVPPGRYALTAVATDDDQVTGRSQIIEITVGTNTPPPITLPVVSIWATDPLAIEGTNCWSWWNRTNQGPGMTNYVTLYSGPVSSYPVYWFTNCGPKNATLTVRRAGDTNADLTVFYKVGGTASNGVDYEPLSGTVVIPAGERKADMLVVPKDDARLEYPETVLVRLILPPTMNPLPPPYKIGYPDRAGAVIIDSSRPRPVTGMLADRCFYLGTSAPDGSWYRIEYTSDFQTWTSVCTNQVIQGMIHFVDPEAQDDTAPTRLYRAKESAPAD